MPRVARRTTRPLPGNPGHGAAFEQYLAEVRTLPLIGSVEEERALAREARRGCPLATERLVSGNLRFVISYVKRYQGQGLDLADLVAIGNEGLLRAVGKFDPERGVKFISYAVWWIRQAVLKALAEQATTVRIPPHRQTARLRLERARRVLARELGHLPSEDELACALDLPPGEVHQTLQCVVRDVSLDAPSAAGDPHSPTLSEHLPSDDPDAPSAIEDQTDHGLRQHFVQRLFQQHLSPREARVLTLYYGLDRRHEPLTLEQIGQLLGVTRERVRQVRERAFAKLRSCPEIRVLGDHPFA